MANWLSLEDFSDYSHLTVDSFSAKAANLQTPVPKKINNSSVLYAAGKAFCGIPAALMILRSTQDGGVEILSLFVAKPFRRLGLASKMMAWIAVEALRLGWHTLRVSYALDHSSTCAMQHLTSTRIGWTHAKGLKLFHLNRNAGEDLIGSLSRFEHRNRSPTDYIIKSLHELSDNELERFYRHNSSPAWARQALLHDELGIGKRDELVSHVLIIAGCIQGSLIAERVGQSLLRVSQWWVAGELQGSLAASKLLYKAVTMSLTCYPKYTKACFGVSADNQKMLSICRRHFESVVYSSYQCEQACLNISRQLEL